MVVLWSIWAGKVFQDKLASLKEISFMLRVKSISRAPVMKGLESFLLPI